MLEEYVVGVMVGRLGVWIVRLNAVLYYAEEVWLADMLRGSHHVEWWLDVGIMDMKASVVYLWAGW